jgi:putative ABC transport system permease protein
MQLPFKLPEGRKMADQFRYRLQFIGDAHFNPTTSIAGGFQATVNSFGLIAVFVLAISMANFVILNLARSVERQREVGIRKVAGALSRALLMQFVFEALLLTGIALGLALVLLDVLLPVFATLMETSLDLGLIPASIWFAAVALVLAIGAIGGLYPALVLSRQRPDRVLRPGGQSGTLGVHGLRKLLVGFQLLIATALISATGVVYLQLTYARQHDPGFDAENVVALYVFSRTPSQVAVLRNAVSALVGVEHVALASVTANGNTEGGLYFVEKLRREGGVESIEAHGYHSDYDFFSVYDMRLLAGRLYDAALDSANQDALASSEAPQFSIYKGGRLVVNESTSRALGFPSPAAAVGAVIEVNEGKSSGEIIGVVADSQFSSLLAPTRNEVYELQSVASWYLTLKVRPEIIPRIESDLRRIWRETGGVGNARVVFVENNVQQAFDREQREARLLLGFAVLAVAVACLGLYGLVAFETRRRTKEIGIRNVLGGEFGSIVALFLKQFSKPLAWACLLACPLALWMLLRWLERFPYQIGRWWLVLACLVAALLVSLIVSLTVSITVFTTARIRPVQALRYE